MAAIMDCPICARPLRIPDDLFGDMVRCPTCGGTFAAPLEVQPRLATPAAVATFDTETVRPLEIAPRQRIPRVPTLKPVLISEEKGRSPLVGVEPSQPATGPLRGEFYSDAEARPCP